MRADQHAGINGHASQPPTATKALRQNDFFARGSDVTGGTGTTEAAHLWTQCDRGRDDSVDVSIRIVFPATGMSEPLEAGSRDLTWDTIALKVTPCSNLTNTRPIWAGRTTTAGNQIESHTQTLNFSGCLSPLAG